MEREREKIWTGEGYKWTKGDKSRVHFHGVTANKISSYFATSFINYLTYYSRSNLCETRVPRRDILYWAHPMREL